MPQLLTDPFLQAPTADSVHVVWFTAFEGQRHVVAYGTDLEGETIAHTRQMGRLSEDEDSHVDSQHGDGALYTGASLRPVWRHEARVPGLEPGQRVPYRVTSVTDAGEPVQSDVFTLTPLPRAGQPMRILLTSDHQLEPMIPANLQKVHETVGPVDAVFFAGDMVNTPDRASEWFDDNRGLAFFPTMQGRTRYTLGGRTYTGAPILQYTPLFPAVGNHEVMGRRRPGVPLRDQGRDTQPRAVAERKYPLYAALCNPAGDPDVRARWIRDNAFNMVTYQEMFTVAGAGENGGLYYAVQFGDVYLIVLCAARMWRMGGVAPDARGKYREADQDLPNPDNWAHGEFIYEDIRAGSRQHDWLRARLDDPAFRAARYKVVMMHFSMHSLGHHSVPVFTDPVPMVERHADGSIAVMRYEYPIDRDYLINDVEPLLEAAGVDLVLSGHSHVWYRFRGKTGIHYLETSNPGVGHGCCFDETRWGLPDAPEYDSANYPPTGDPHGLTPEMPTLFAPMSNAEGQPLPCVSSRDVSVFSVLDTGTGTISSYCFDTREPDAGVRKFDEFSL
jgi:hypothetical protein